MSKADQKCKRNTDHFQLLCSSSIPSVLDCLACLVLLILFLHLARCLSSRPEAHNVSLVLRHIVLLAVAWFSDVDFSEESNLLDEFIVRSHGDFVESVHYGCPESCSTGVVRLRSGSVAHCGGTIHFPTQIYNSLALFDAIL
jgi:hypothetical protein